MRENFIGRAVLQWYSCPGGVGQSPSLEVLENSGDVALRVSGHGGGGLGDPRGLLHDSMNWQRKLVLCLDLGFSSQFGTG